MSLPEQQHVLAQQAALYGGPLADSVARVTATLGLSQAAVARLVGVSAPMLSQLVTGRRIKLANPVAVQRLTSLLALCDDVDTGLPHETMLRRLEDVGREPGTTLTGPRAPSRTDGPALVTALLRAVASGREILAAAQELEPAHPELARVLRTYGAGTPQEAEEHYRSLAPLLGPDRIQR